MKFKLFGIEIAISPLFFPTLTIMLLVDRTGLSLPVICATAIHEAGHIIMMKIVGKRIKKIELIPSAVLIKGDAFYSFAEEFFISSAGIMGNLIFAVVFIILSLVFKYDFIYYVAANVCIAIINILPVEGLDGGKILTLFLQRLTSKWSIVLKIISLLFAASFLLLSINFFIGGFSNISTIIFSVYILVAALIKV